MLQYRIRTESGAIVIAGSCIADASANVDFTIEAAGTELHAGLINAHDHLHRNHDARLGSPSYDDAYAWGLDIHARCAGEIDAARSVPRRDALLFGALKNLAGGATTVVHHDAWEPEFDNDFPLRVVRTRTVHSLRFDAERAAVAARERSGEPLMIHLAEGVTEAAADEIREAHRAGLLDENLLAVHCVGVDEDGIERMRHARAAVVWCPSSNHFLFGRTAPAALLDAVDVLLGTDALLTGNGTLLDEIAAARRTRLLDDVRLIDAVGETAARRLRLPIPRLDAGAPADLVLLRKPLLEASPCDVALVIVAGLPRIGEELFAPLFDAAGMEARRITLDGMARLVQSTLADAADHAARAAVGLRLTHAGGTDLDR